MLADVLLKVLEDEEAENGQHDYYPRPSLAGAERCARQMVYWARKEDRRPLPGRAISVMRDSGWHEELTADLIRKTVYQLHSEQIPITVPNAYPWLTGEYKCHVCNEMVKRADCHGHCDYLVTDPEGKDWLIEHKGLSQFGFDALMKAQAPRNQDDLRAYTTSVRKLMELLPLDYLTQTAIYLKGLLRVNPDLNRALLLVKNKNQSGYLEFSLQYDEPTDCLKVIERVHHTGEREPIGIELGHIVQEAFDKFALVQQHFQGGTLPPRAYDLDHWRCEYCQYAETCWKGWPEEHARLKTAADLAEIAELVEHQKDLGSKITALDKQRDVATQSIKDQLTKLGIRSGVAGGYSIEWKVAMQKKLDPELLPLEAKAAATVERPSERLNIRKLHGAK